MGNAHWAWENIMIGWLMRKKKPNEITFGVKTSNKSFCIERYLRVNSLTIKMDLSVEWKFEFIKKIWAKLLSAYKIPRSNAILRSYLAVCKRNTYFHFRSFSSFSCLWFCLQKILAHRQEINILLAYSETGFKVFWLMRRSFSCNISILCFFFWLQTSHTFASFSRQHMFIDQGICSTM